MARHIYSLFKIGKQEYLEQFRDGMMYMNQISYFKEYKNEGGEFRGDPLEGIVVYVSPQDGVSVSSNGITVPSLQLLEPFTEHSNDVLAWNAFCMYAMHSGEFTSLSQETLGRFRDSMRVDAANLGLGERILVIHDAVQFRERLVVALEREGMDFEARLCEYHDETSFSGAVRHPGFWKSSAYKHQNEYRIIRKVPSNGVYKLRIGSIDDICFITTFDELNNTLQVSLSEEETP